jgi:hypothetical protein
MTQRVIKLSSLAYRGVFTTFFLWGALLMASAPAWAVGESTFRQIQEQYRNINHPQVLVSWREMARLIMEERNFNQSQFRRFARITSSNYAALMEGRQLSDRVIVALVRAHLLHHRREAFVSILQLPDLQDLLSCPTCAALREEMTEASLLAEIKNTEAAPIRAAPYTRDLESAWAAPIIESWVGDRYEVEKRARLLIENSEVTAEFLAFKTGYTPALIDEFVRTGVISLNTLKKGAFVKVLAMELEDYDPRKSASAQSYVEEFKKWQKGIHPLQIEAAEDAEEDRQVRRERSLQKVVLSQLKEQQRFKNPDILQVAGLPNNAVNRGRISRILDPRVGITRATLLSPDEFSRLQYWIEHPASRIPLRELRQQARGTTETQSGIDDEGEFEMATDETGEVIGDREGFPSVGREPVLELPRFNAAEIPLSPEIITADIALMKKILGEAKMTFLELLRSLGKTVNSDEIRRAHGWGLESTACGEYLGKNRGRRPRWSRAAHERLREISDRFYGETNPDAVSIPVPEVAI